MWMKSTLIFTAVALLGQCAFAGAGTRPPPLRSERCMTSEEHEASLEVAIRMHGRSAILTHTEHPSICKERAAPDPGGQGRD